jgi:uncharacterized membrane protein YoaK (UPF0700 family)
MNQNWQRVLALMTSFALGAAVGSSLGYAFGDRTKNR